MMQRLEIDGKPLGVGEAVRLVANNAGVLDVSSPDMSCGVNGDVAAASYAEVAPGQELGFGWRHDRDYKGIVMTPGHWGPTYVYAAPAKSNGKGDVWVKISEDLPDDGNGNGPFDRLKANDGVYSIKLPDLEAGDYLFRAEAIALQQAYRYNDAQLYIGCAQIRVTGNGNKALPSGVAFPGAYKADDAGLFLKGDATSHKTVTGYKSLGPAVSSLKDVAKKVVQKVVEQVVEKKPQEDAPAKEEAAPAPKKTPEPKQAVKKEPEAPKAESTPEATKEQPKKEQPKKEEAKAPAARDAAPAAPRKCIRRRSSSLRKRANDAYSQYMIRSRKRDVLRS